MVNCVLFFGFCVIILFTHTSANALRSSRFSFECLNTICKSIKTYGIGSGTDIKTQLCKGRVITKREGSTYGNVPRRRNSNSERTLKSVTSILQIGKAVN